MDAFRVFTRRQIVIPLAMVAAVAMVFISEAGYWRSIHTLNEITVTDNVRASIQGLRQSVLAAQAAQRSYLLTKRQVHLTVYNKALQEISLSFKVLEQRYAPDPGHAATLQQLRSVTNTLLTQLAQDIQQFDLGQNIIPDDSDDVQIENIHALSTKLLDIEVDHAAFSQTEIYKTLMMSRVGVALLSAISLLAVVMYLRQSFALERQRQEVQRIVQTERDRLELEVRQRTLQLTELTLHLQTAREDERHRLARNLHDDLGALLTSAKLDAARIRSRLMNAGSVTEALELLAHLVATLNSGIALGRRIIEDLRPSALGTLGLVATLEILVSEYAANAGVQVHSQFDPVPLDADGELMVYRLVQEALTNISKHAKAHAVWVSLSQHHDQVEVVVRDDGVGFDPQAQTSSAYGLVGMRFRVEAQGGTLKVTSAPGRGTEIHVRLPGAHDAGAGSDTRPL